MLSKKLLLTTENQPAGHIKLTVGIVSNSGVCGYFKLGNIGSVSRVPTWNFEGKPLAMANLITYPDTPRTTLVFDYADKVDADSITMTIVEKGLTVTLYWSSVQYVADVTAFNSSDVGKTFTIVFDSEPTGYA